MGQELDGGEAASVPRILVVDDTPDNLFLMNGLFEDRFHVLQAASGQEALKQAMSDAPPDMVLLDIMMPDMDGYEVLRRIRQHPPTANIPVIFLTALATPHDERLGRDLGAVDYLTKPVDPAEVIRRVEAHVQAAVHARRMEALSEKLSRHLCAWDWQQLFQGPGLAGIRFEERPLTLVYAETTLLPTWGERERDGFDAEVHWLAERHAGQRDAYVFGASVTFFEDAHAAVRMASELQRSCVRLQLRVGVHSAGCVLAHFTANGRAQRALVGPALAQAARVAATAAAGSIALSPACYARVEPSLHDDAGACLLTQDFQDSDLARAWLTPAPRKGLSPQSTFTGLGASELR